MLLVCDEALAVTEVVVSLVVEAILLDVVVDATLDEIVGRAVALIGLVLRIDETSEISELRAAAAEDSALKAELRDSEGGTLVIDESSRLLLVATTVMVEVVGPPYMDSDDPMLSVAYVVEVDEALVGMVFDGSSFDTNVVGYDIVSVSRALIRIDKALGGVVDVTVANVVKFLYIP